MAYKVELLESALKQLEALPSNSVRLVMRNIRGLGDDPRPATSTILQGQADLRRIRAGDYRIIYGVDDGAGSVLIIAVGHRREIYDGLESLAVRFRDWLVDRRKETQG